MLLDVKSGDPDTYKKVTGRPLAPTLDFGRRLSAHGVKIWTRFVLVPGLTDDERNVDQVADYLASLDTVERVEVLPFHQMGREKWKAAERALRARRHPAALARARGAGARAVPLAGHPDVLTARESDAVVTVTMQGPGGLFTRAFAVPPAAGTP
ncbi:hypothetical protein GCM10025876_09220 [Demequina litorisediminis]|uniref:[Formate-C-acetyltransferase]-activating enzyme n=1 Tax=Demequina litorisediminis TaxID=1849022 RepID=A0ABQ6IA30_9MICO|nr:hypothetical protein GCM10025876_09220 [Demequina litorisediminis]